MIGDASVSCSTSQGFLTLAGAKHLCTALGQPERVAQLSENGTGWALVAAINHTSGATSALFAQWWCEEDLNDAVQRHICVTAFPGSRLNERCVWMHVLRATKSRAGDYSACDSLALNGCVMSLALT